MSLQLTSTAGGANEGAVLADMLVIDANIPIRAVLGSKVRKLFQTYSSEAPLFLAPELAFEDAAVYLPSILAKRNRFDIDVAASMAYLQRFVEPVPHELYAEFEEESRERLRLRDEEDWPVLAAALATGAAIRSEDKDFFGTGVAVWTTSRVEIYLKKQVLPEE